MQEVFLRPLLRSGPPSWLQNVRNQQVLARRLITAFDSRSRRSGLLGRERFDDDHAMIIAPSNAIHTFFMRFPIDVAFVTRGGRVVKACHAVKPWRIAGAFRAFAAIELPAGTLRRSETIAGDILEIVRAP